MCSIMHGMNEEMKQAQGSDEKPSDPQSGAASILVGKGSFQHHFEITNEVGDDEAGAERQRAAHALSRVCLPEHVHDDDGELFSWAKFTLRVVNDHCSWVVDPGKDMPPADLTAAIKKTPAGRFQVRSTDKESDYVGIWSRNGVGFESNSRAWDRVPPLQDRLKTRILAVAARFPETGSALPEKDIYFQGDHCKHGLSQTILAPFSKAKPKLKGVTHLNFDGPALRARKHMQRGSYAGCKSTEWLHVVSQQKVKIPVKDNIHFPGVNIDDSLGPIVVPKFDAPEIMQVLYKDKPALYGYARVKCGGPVSDDEESAANSDSSNGGATQKARSKLPKPNDEVPMTYNNFPWQLFDEITHGANIKAWIETSTADETLALLCCLRQIPFTGVVPTEAMREALEARLVHRLWAKFSDEKDKHHKIQLVKLLKQPAPNKDEKQRAPNKDEMGKPKDEQGGQEKQTKRSFDESAEGGMSGDARPAKKKSKAKPAAGGNDDQGEGSNIESLLTRLRAAESDVAADDDAA